MSWNTGSRAPGQPSGRPLVTPWPLTDQSRHISPSNPSLQVPLDVHPSQHPRGPLLPWALCAKPEHQRPHPLLLRGLAQQQLRPVSRDTDRVQPRPELFRGTGVPVHPPRPGAQVPLPCWPHSARQWVFLGAPCPAGVGSPQRIARGRWAKTPMGCADRALGAVPLCLWLPEVGSPRARAQGRGG